MLFNSELALVNRELNKKWPYLEPYVAQFSGQAHWMRILRRRIDRVMNVSAWPLPRLVLVRRWRLGAVPRAGRGPAPGVSPERLHGGRPRWARGLAGAGPGRDEAGAWDSQRRRRAWWVEPESR